MRIGQRLVIAVMPGIVGVFAVAGLAYWGERDRQIPGVLLSIVTTVTLLSLWFAWVTTRDVARRIQRLGRLVDAHRELGASHEPTLLTAVAREAIARLTGAGKTGADELDAIERLISRFDDKISRLAERERANESRLSELRAETSRLLHDAGDRIAKNIDDVRMPLHVLLETPFGTLNENQEELLGVARSAADEASASARQLREIGALELSTGARRDRIAAADLLRALSPLLQAEARRGRVRLTFDIAPALPAVSGDRARLQEALREVLARVIRGAVSDSAVAVVVAPVTAGVRVTGAPVRNLSLDELSAERRLLEALGAQLSLRNGEVAIELPVWK